VNYRSDGSVEKVLVDPTSFTDLNLPAFERELLRLSNTFRLTFLPDDHRGGQMMNCQRVGITAARGKHSNQPPYKKVSIETGLGQHWLTTFFHSKWGETREDHKHSAYLLLATLLIHELAHAVWSHRMIPLLEDEFTKHGELTVDKPEPKWVESDVFWDLGYAIQLQLFSGLPNFNFPDHFRGLKTDAISFGTLDIKGKIMGLHRLTRKALMTISDPVTWTQNANGVFSDIVLDLRPNAIKSNKRLSTVLSRQARGTLVIDADGQAEPVDAEFPEEGEGGSSPTSESDRSSAWETTSTSTGNSSHSLDRSSTWETTSASSGSSSHSLDHQAQNTPPGTVHGPAAGGNGGEEPHRSQSPRKNELPEVRAWAWPWCHNN
jgi:hypothetical protein